MEKLPYNLTKEEMAMLQAFVTGPAYKILKKITDQEIASLHGMLETEANHVGVARLQGRITGTRAMIAVPFTLVAQKVGAEHKAAEEKRRIQRRQRREPAEI